MMRIIGFGDGSYTSKRDGKRKEGYRLYLAGERDGVTGQSCEAVWLRKDVGDDLVKQVSAIDDLIGFEVLLNYDRYQHVQQVLLYEAVVSQGAK